MFRYKQSITEDYAMPNQELQEILKKFETEEQKIDNLLKNRKQDNKLHTANSNRLAQFPTFEQAVERNKNILKELETVTGNLRTKAIFSPTEMHWENICKRYQEEPSLPITTWRCNLPVFV